MKKLAFKMVWLFLLLGAMNVSAASKTTRPAFNIDYQFQEKLEEAIEKLGLTKAVDDQQLALSVLKISDRKEPIYASLNGSRMYYAASLPKIAILLGAFHKQEKGLLNIDAENLKKLTLMIRKSSNAAATEMMNLVGMEYIASLLQSNEYNFYDSQNGGGLWVGKEYSKNRVWKRDPLYGLSHAATSDQVIRFYYMLVQGTILTSESRNAMLDILNNSEINHKFVKGLADIDKSATIYRKSGSWKEFHSDSALIVRGEHQYIVAALTKSTHGESWLQGIIKAVDAIVVQP